MHGFMKVKIKLPLY